MKLTVRQTPAPHLSYTGVTHMPTSAMSLHAAVTSFLALYVLFTSASSIMVRDNDVAQHGASPWVVGAIIIALVLFIATLTGFHFYRKLCPDQSRPQQLYRATPNRLSPVMGRRTQPVPALRSPSLVTTQPSALGQSSFSGQNIVLVNTPFPPRAHVAPE